MLKNCCIVLEPSKDGLKILFEFPSTVCGLGLIAALDDAIGDILPDLIDAQCCDLRRELATACQIANDSNQLSGVTSPPVA